MSPPQALQASLNKGLLLTEANEWVVSSTEGVVGRMYNHTAVARFGRAGRRFHLCAIQMYVTIQMHLTIHFFHLIPYNTVLCVKSTQ